MYRRDEPANQRLDARYDVERLSEDLANPTQEIETAWHRRRAPGPPP